MPGQQIANALMSPNGGLQIGSWVTDTASTTTKDVVAALHSTYARRLIALEKAQKITSGQSMRLDALRQFVWVTGVLARKSLDNGVSFQVLEPMESELVTIVHNIRVEYPESN